MTELNPDTPDKPIQVAAKPGGQQVATLSRDALLIISTLPALVALFGRKDVMEIVNWFAGQQGLAFIGAIVVLATPLYRQWLARRKHANELKLAKSVPDRVAVVKGEGA